MRKLLSSVSSAALVLCLTLQVAYAMIREEQGGEERKVECSNLGSKIKIRKNKNKEQYFLIKENFSTENYINFKELYEHIHYKFKNKDLLIDALYPLLPTALQRPKQKFEQLEFLGDAALGYIIRGRILDLFPDEERGMQNKLYEALICNKTLAEVYLLNLGIEPYLPYPGERVCQYCNVIESIIGAISKDNPNNDLTQQRKFVMRILDDHLFIQKRNEILESEKIKSKNYENKLQTFSILPNLKKVMNEVLENSNIDKTNPKSLLGMILEKTLRDQPKYEVSLGRNESNIPVFIVNVIGAQIGHTITGIGFTKDEAEQNAARNAINFLAQEERMTQKRLDNSKQTYTKFINDYCQAQGLKLSCKDHTPVFNFTCHVKVGEKIIGGGRGFSKGEAREEAAYKACEYLTNTEGINFTKLSNKKYISILEEFVTQKKISDVNFIDIKASQSIVRFKFQVKVDVGIIGEGSGSTKTEAKEEAAQKAYHYLIENGKPEYENLNGDRKYKSILEEWAAQKKISDYVLVETEACQPVVGFKFQVKVDEDVVGEGTGSTKIEAKENAAQEAYNYLIENGKIEILNLKIGKKYSSVLQEWASQNKIANYELIERSSPPTVKFQVIIEQDIVADGEGFSEEAKENAYQSAFEQLLKNQEEARKDKEIRKASAKKVKEPYYTNLSPQLYSFTLSPHTYGSLYENPTEKPEKFQARQTASLASFAPIINSSNQNIKINGQKKSKTKKWKKQVQQTTEIKPVTKENFSQNGQQQRK